MRTTQSTLVLVFALIFGSTAAAQHTAPTQWTDEFGRQVADKLVLEAKRIQKPGNTAPVEVTLKFTVQPFTPKIEKPVWTPEDIMNLDVCAQICGGGLRCYVQCKMPVEIPGRGFTPVLDKCDELRLKHFREQKEAGCIGPVPGKR